MKYSFYFEDIIAVKITAFLVATRFILAIDIMDLLKCDLKIQVEYMYH